MALSIGVLGDVAVMSDGEHLPLARARERALLTALALAHPAPVSAPRLADAVWGESGGGSTATIRSYVSRLRHVLGPDVIASGPSGYELAVDAQALDVHLAESLLQDGAAAYADGRYDEARAATESALALWRGEPFAELDTAAAIAARSRLARRRAEGHVLLADAMLALGRPARAVEVLATACAAAPLDEGLWARWVEALAADGRRDEALHRHDEIRHLLAAELGLDPGDALTAARAAVLAGEAATTRRMPIRYADADGRALCHAVLGRTGPHVLLLHGLFMPSEMLAEEPSAATMLDRLSRRHRLVLVDLGGLGLSDAVDPAVMSFEGWAADAAAVLDHLEVGRVGVIGLGPSTAVAMHLAASRPELVSRLVLFGVPLRAAWGNEQIDELLAQIDGQPATRDAVGYLAPSRSGDAAFTAWLDRGGERGARPAVARAFYHLLFSTDLTDLVARTVVPTLVIDRPDAIANGRHAAEVVSLLADGHLVAQPGIPDALPWLGDSQGFVDSSLAFLDGATPAPASRLMAVAITGDVPAGAAPARTAGPVVTAHDRPGDALSAASRRVAEGARRAVVHVGLVAPGAPPTGPAVDAALVALPAAATGEVARTAAFDAVTGPD